MVDELPDTGEVDPGEVAEDEFDESYDPDTFDTSDIIQMVLYQVDQLAHADLCYAPPYAPAVDNILTAADVMRNKLDGRFRGVSAEALQAELSSGAPPVPIYRSMVVSGLVTAITPATSPSGISITPQPRLRSSSIIASWRGRSSSRSRSASATGWIPRRISVR